MKKLDINEIRKISIDILIDITTFCEENNITYYLSVGTLLGAARHKGFIPWDDDIDIMMPRPDYNKLLNSYNGKYKIYKPGDGRLYYAKAYDQRTIKYEKNIDYKKYMPLGVDIDIFPLDGSVLDDKKIKIQYKKACILEMLLRLSNQPIFLRKNPFKCINRIIPRLIGSKKISDLIIKNAQRYSYDNSDYIVRMRRSTNGFIGTLPKSIYNPPTKLEFENRQYFVPRNYNVWLKEFYGEDFMILPPKEKQKSHDMECYKI